MAAKQPKPMEHETESSALMALNFQIMAAVNIITQLSSTLGNKVLTPHGFSMTQFKLLNHIVQRGKSGLTVTEIAQAMQSPQPGVTKNVRKLVDSGILSERPHPEDGRSKILFLTTEGRRQHNAAVHTLSSVAGPAFSPLSPADREAMLAGLKQIKTWFDENR